MTEPLPLFRYHPDPIKTGSIAVSDKQCVCCGKARGYIYTIAPYTEQDIDEESLCPWCIGDGAAHKKYRADFVDANGIPDDVPEAVVKELVERTPGYAAWQSEEWRSCCGDAAAFLGPFGYMDVMRAQADGSCDDLVGIVMRYIMEDLDYQGRAASLFAESLDRDKGPTAYVFQCLHCQRCLAYIDFP